MLYLIKKKSYENQRLNYLFIIYLFCTAGIWTQGLHHEPLHQPFFAMGFSS
jgi:hypothetical protein